MLGGINNGLFLQSFGGFVGLALLVIVLKWGFSSNRKLIVTPIKAGKKDAYGLLKPLPTPSNYIEAQMALQKLVDSNIKATLTQTLAIFSNRVISPNVVYPCYHGYSKTVTDTQNLKCGKCWLQPRDDSLHKKKIFRTTSWLRVFDSNSVASRQIFYLENG